jgi:CDP-diacylglycerol--inositol 3-phosphatidyltransferase
MPPRRRNAPVDVDAEEALGLATAQSENVFLFIPNLIGKSACVLCQLYRSPSRSLHRLHSHYPCRPIPALHELSPHLLYARTLWNDALEVTFHRYDRVLCFVSPRCLRRLCRSQIPPRIQVRRRPRHGHRQVRFFMSAQTSDSNGWARCTTSCLLCYLSSAYPDYALAFQFLIALDFSSHYMHMYRWVAALACPTRPFIPFAAPSSLGQ